MKKFILLFLILQIKLISYSQEKNYKITYRHCVQYDTMQKLQDTIGLEAILIGNSKESNYRFAKLPSNYKPITGAKTFADVVNGKNKKNGTEQVVVSGFRYDTIGNMVYQNKLAQKILVREKMANEYLLTQEQTPVINWEITGEKKMIKNYECQQAITYFRGRYYIAWFTTDIPVIAAPWKFNGLPGLLMDIEDIKHQVKIYVESVEYPTKGIVSKFIAKGNSVTLDKYFERREVERKKFEKSMLTLMENQAPNNARPDNIKFKVSSTSALYNIEIREN